MSNLTPFNFEGASLRVIDQDGEPWFVAADVCRALEMSAYNVASITSRLDPDEKMVIANPELSLNLTKGQKAARLTVINESGLYSLVLRSDKPAAKRFKKWVTSEVLPSIRKTGAYIAPKAEPHPAESLAVCNQFLAVAMTALPNLCERSRQALIASTTEFVVGRALIPSPVVDEPFFTTSQIAAEAGVSPQLAGKRAKAFGLKTADHGEVRLSKSQFSDKQVEQFYWNASGREALLSVLRWLQ